MNELAKITEPAPMTLIVFGGESSYVSTTCEIADRSFAHRIEYVFASPNTETYGDIAERFEASVVTIALPDVCQGLRELGRESGSPEEILFPCLGGGTVAIALDRARWMEEQLELVHWDVGSISDDRTGEDSFLRGATVSWKELNVGVDADRDITAKLARQLRQELEERATRRVNLWHWPGTGATTVARRIAWNIQREFPTVVALEIHPHESAERLKYLFGITRLPVLVVIDLPGVTKEVVDRFYDMLRSSHIPAVLFNVQRRFDTHVGAGSHYLDAMLTTREAVGLAGVLAARVPDRRPMLEDLIDEPGSSKKKPVLLWAGCVWTRLPRDRIIR